ncbi:kelch-like protein 12 isoform X1 [Tachysurus ichikawai]
MAPKYIMTNLYTKSILNAMNALRKSNTLCDITLRVENTDFPAHRIVLAACSDYFCAMFTSEMAENGRSFVDIQGIAASTMEILLDFVYTETVLVTVENVQFLLPACSNSKKHFSEVMQHEEFMLLSQSEVEKLVKCDEIQVDSEEPVFEAVLNWEK